MSRAERRGGAAAGGHHQAHRLAHRQARVRYLDLPARQDGRRQVERLVHGLPPLRSPRCDASAAPSRHTMIRADGDEVRRWCGAEPQAVGRPTPSWYRRYVQPLRASAAGREAAAGQPQLFQATPASARTSPRSAISAPPAPRAPLTLAGGRFILNGITPRPAGRVWWFRVRRQWSGPSGAMAAQPICNRQVSGVRIPSRAPLAPAGRVGRAGETAGGRRPQGWESG